MNILLINGSPHISGTTKRALIESECELKNNGANTSWFEIGTHATHACIACGTCKSGNGCIFPDIDELASLCYSSDGIIIGTPTHYATAPGSLISMLSRLLFSSKKAVEHKPVAIIGVGRRGCVSESIREIKKFFEFSSSPIISGCYPALLYGNDKDSAERDKEGLQNMRSIAKNIYWIAKCIELGKENGIYAPIEEEKIKTDISTLI